MRISSGLLRGDLLAFSWRPFGLLRKYLTWPSMKRHLAYYISGLLWETLLDFYETTFRSFMRPSADFLWEDLREKGKASKKTSFGLLDIFLFSALRRPSVLLCVDHLLWEDPLAFHNNNLWPSMRRNSAFLWEDFWFFYETIFLSSKGRPSGLPRGDLLVFCKKTFFASMRRPSSLLQAGHPVFYEKTLWASITELAGPLWKDHLCFYEKALWTSMNRRSHLLWEDPLDFFDKNLWPSMRRSWTFLWEDFRFFSCLLPFFHEETFWSFVRRHFLFYKKIFFSALRDGFRVFFIRRTVYEKLWPSMIRPSGHLLEDLRLWDDLWEDLRVFYEKAFASSIRRPSTLIREDLRHSMRSRLAYLWENFPLFYKETFCSSQRTPSALFREQLRFLNI